MIQENQAAEQTKACDDMKQWCRGSAGDHQPALRMPLRSPDAVCELVPALPGRTAGDSMPPSGACSRLETHTFSSISVGSAALMSKYSPSVGDLHRGGTLISAKAAAMCRRRH